MKLWQWPALGDRLAALRGRGGPRFIFITISVIMKPHRFSRRVLIPTSVVSLLFIGLLFSFIYSSVLVATTGKSSFTSHGHAPHTSRGSQRNHRFKSRFVLDANKDDTNLQNYRKQAKNWGYQQLVNSIKEKPQCVRDPLIVILITTAPRNVDQRRVIRATWCSRRSHQKVPEETSQCVFIIGNASDAATNKLILKESKEYGDILLADFQDTYRNLTYKVITGLFWSVTECKSKFLLKTDDDCFVNIHVLKRFLHIQTKVTQVYVGNVFREMKDLHVIRESHSKWAVSRDSYAPDYYPKYASGTGYVLSRDVVANILETSRLYSPFPNEDAYIGVLAEHLHITPTHSYRFTFLNTKWTLCNFLYLLVIHRVTLEQQVKFMAFAEQVLTNCSMYQFFNSWN